MYVQIITFRLDGMPSEDFAALCDQVAPQYAEIEGCVAKLFVRDPVDGTRFGGVYVWETHESADAYLREGLATLLVDHPLIADFEVSHLEIVPGPTSISGGPFADTVRRAIVA